MSTGQAEANPKPAGPADPSPRQLPRWSLALLAGLHGLIFAWAGAKLPWSDWSSFTIVCYLLALGHGLTAVSAALGLRALAPIWRVSSAFGLIVFGWLAWELSSSASYLAGLYGSLGEGIGAGLLAVAGLVALLSVPISAWGLAATWRRSYNPGAAAAMPLLLCVWTLGALRQAENGHAEPTPLPGEFDLLDRNNPSVQNDVVEALLFAELSKQIEHWGVLPEVPTEGPIQKVKGGYRHAKLRVPSLFTTAPVACVPDLESGESAAVVTYLVLSKKPSAKPDEIAAVEPATRCIRAAPAELIPAIVALIESEALRAPVKIDVISGVAPLRSRVPALDMFSLRPGLDGVCDEHHCLMPWQLVALSQFTANLPLPFVPDFRVGISAVELRDALGFEVPEQVLRYDREQRNPGRLARLIESGKATERPADIEAWRLLEGLTRIETLSYMVTRNGLHTSLVRMHKREVRLSQNSLDQAREAADVHIAKAQLKDGRFRYTLDPFTGDQELNNWNLPRQAGTTLVMCELGNDARRTRRVAGLSLKFMARHAREAGELTPLTKRARSEQADLGSTALPAIAFARCREHIGNKHDRTFAGMTRFLLAMQRDNGSFYPLYDIAGGHIIDGPEPMYAGGQAIFALSLAEKLALDEPDAAAAAGLPSAEVLHEAVERAMAFYTGPYWATFVRDFFWLEENWHCMAARASLEHHRNDAYERYCIDYMTYKARLVLDESSDVAREFHGGYSFGNILTPVNTPAAGFGEGMAAAIALKQARGEDISADVEQMHTVIEFLLRQQWNQDNCFACTPHRTVVGGFSESMSAPEIRIDYTQHAWSALGHGGAWIYDELPTKAPGEE
ncbi:hypothetical protein DB30_02420 [Enhygromyxa salina]|uniref:Uncharacterized protein n=1 Tax=Enhygromyxa salina TaxID=215803 RepID=A0A0C2CKS6_9BACT|nr:hypothetical protein [Enhygromyxa salina]KIG11816.1 hypothetical protein DB30_02420 [Enhygromyxa salina]